MKRPVQNEPVWQACVRDRIAEARAGGFTGDDATLRTFLEERLRAIEEIQDEIYESGQELLRAIANAGGIRPSSYWAWLSDPRSHRS